MQNTVYFGDRKIVLEKVKKELNLENNLIFEIEKMQISVDDIRRMKDFVYKTSENIKYIFLSSFYWSEEVQNAMLKVLEETPVNTFIFLFGYSNKNFLPTVLSRVQKVQMKNTNRYLKEAGEVLKLENVERLDNKIVKKILGLKVIDINYEKNLENEKKDRESIILFLYALIEILLNDENFKKDKNILEKINTITKFADIEGGNPTLFVEWLLLSAPKVVL